jgi:hypothetical protein
MPIIDHTNNSCATHPQEVKRAKLVVGDAPVARGQEASEKLKCDKCGSGLKFNKRLKKKKLVRFWCKNAECKNMVSLPDTGGAVPAW